VQVKRVGYVGLRTSDVEGMTGFLRDVLGLEAVSGDEAVTFQRLPTHERDLVEVYSETYSDPRLIPDNPAFGEWAWFWVRAPDGRIYVLQQIPD
jgi:catechol 2,3-dioxygenase-like lactoylglutathione lyase family enzyme